MIRNELRIGLPKRKRFSAATITVLLCFTGTAQVTYTWTGASGNAWNNNANWTPNTGYPLAADNAVIPAGSSSVLLDIPRSVNNLTISTGTLDLNGLSLTVGGNGIFSSGAVNNGTLALSSPAGTCTFSGTTFGAAVQGNSANVLFNGSVFHAPVRVSKTGTGGNTSTGGNTFNSILELSLASSATWEIAYTNPDLYNGDVLVNCTGTGNIRFGFGAGSATLASGHTLSIGTGGFSSGRLYLMDLVQVGSTPQNLTLSGTAEIYFRTGTVFNGPLTVTSPRVFMDGGTYNSTVTLTNTGTANTSGAGGCTFNDRLEVNCTGSGEVHLCETGIDQYNGDVVLNNTGGGIRFGNTSGTATLASGRTLSIGSGGFSAGLLLLKNFHQVGSSAQSLTLTGTALTYLYPGISFDGPLTIVSPRIFVSGGTYNNTTDLTTTSNTSSAGAGGCIFNNTLTLTSAGAGEFQLCDTGTDQYNGDIVLNNPVGGGMRFGNNGGTALLAAGHRIMVGAGGFSSGLLLLKGFQQLGSTPQSLVTTGTTILYLRPGTLFNGKLQVTASRIAVDGGTYQDSTSFVMTGNTNCSGSGGCTFNGPLDLNTTGTGQLYLCNSGMDNYNGDITVSTTGGGGVRFGDGGGTGILAAGHTLRTGAAGFNSGLLLIRGFQQIGATPQTIALTGTSYLYFRSGTTFNGTLDASAAIILLDGGTYNAPARFTMSGNSTASGAGGCVFNSTLELTTTGTGTMLLHTTGNDLFNDDIFVNSTGTGGGFWFGGGVGTGTLAPGHVIRVGSAGFISGSLTLQNFTQIGPTPQSLILSGSAQLNFYPGSTFDGAVTCASPRLAFNGSTFNDAVNATMNGAYSVNSGGGNTFNSTLELTITGSADMRMHINNNDAFNGDVRLNSIGGTGIRFGSGGLAGFGTLAAGRTITVGSGGFDAGWLMFDNFTQLGGTPQSLTLTGTSSLYCYNGTTFNADLTTASPRLFLNGGIYQGTSSFTKTGGSNDNSSGGCTFNGPLFLSTTGSGEIRMHVSANDSYNNDITLTNVGGGGIRFGTGSSTGMGTLAAGHVVQIGSGGFNAGNLAFNNFVQLGGVPQSLTITGTSTLTFFTGTVFNARITTASPRLFLNGATFMDVAQFSKTGPVDDASTGGNTFNGPTELISSNTGAIWLDATGIDAFNDDLLVNSTSTGGIRFGQNGGSATLASGKTLGVGTSGFSGGLLLFRNFTQLGSALPNSLLCTGTSALYFQTGSTFNASLNTTSGALYLNGTTFNNTLTCLKTGNSNDVSTGGCTFNGATDLIITGNGTLQLENTAADAFNDDLRVSCNGTGGILFGLNTGTATLAAGHTISVGSSGYTSGVLNLRNFTQLGGTAQNISMSAAGTALLQIRTGTTFNGPLTADSPGLLLDGGTFNGSATFTKRGTANNASRGGNTFNGPARIVSAGTGYLLLGNSQPDVFNSTADLVRTGAGVLYVAHSANATFMDAISLVGSTGIVQFGQNGGTTIISGPGDRTFNGVAAYPPTVRNLRMNTSAGGKLLLNVTMDITGATDFVTGEIHASGATSTANGIVRFANTCTFPTPANANSFIDGFVRKTGNTAFTFPVGDNGQYAPVSISAPSNATHHFTARYYDTDANPTYSDASKDASIDHISDCEYWIVDRTNGTSNVSVTLSWDSPRSCGVNAPADLVVARWNGTMWKNHGNGAWTGSNPSGTVTTAAAVTSFSPFTLASRFSNNPLPVELLDFSAKPIGAEVECTWATASEQDNDHFDVQRSRDGVTFTTIGEVAGAGNSQTLRNYELIDRDPLIGLSYYRLAQVDLDGTVTESAMVAVERVGQSMLTFVPDPASDVVQVVVNDGHRLAQAVIFDVQGRAVRMIDTKNGELNGPIPVHDLPSGVYTMRAVMTDGSTQEGRFMRE